MDNGLMAKDTWDNLGLDFEKISKEREMDRMADENAEGKKG